MSRESWRKARSFSLWFVVAALACWGGKARSQGWQIVSTAAVSATMVGGTVAAAAARGGVELCVDDWPGEDHVRAIRYEHGRLLGTLGTGETEKVWLSPVEMRELAAAALADADGCVEVSIDPVADGMEDFESEELHRAPSVSLRLLALDEQIAALLSGSIELPASLKGEVPTPYDEARRLLAPGAEDPEYRRLALTHATPPRSWHSTTLRMKHDEAGWVSLDMLVRPTPVFMTADGRREHASDRERDAASRPYQPLAKRLAATPERFTRALPTLRHGLRYADAYAMLIDCRRRAGCAPSLAKLAGSDLDPDVDSSVLRELESAKTSLKEIRDLLETVARNAHLDVLWRDYRLSAAPGLPEDHRVAIFVDEAIATLRSTTLASVSTLETPLAPERLAGLLEGIEVDQNPFAGWIRFGQFLTAVWSGQPMELAMNALGRAWDRAHRDGDRPLQKQILLAARGLLPVMSSNLHVAEMMGGAQGRVPVWFDPEGAQPCGATLEGDAYLDLLNVQLPATIQRLDEQELERIAGGLRPLLDERALSTARSAEALGWLATLEHAHLLSDGSSVQTPALVELGAIHYLVGRGLLNEGARDLARDRARVLESMAKRLESEGSFAEASGLRDMAHELRRVAL